MNAPAMTRLRSLRSLLVGVVDPGALPEVAVSGLSLDSRDIEPGSLFLALQGTRSHGLAHVGDALRSGAAAVLWEPVPGVAAPQLPVPAIAVEQLSARAGAIAARYYDDPSAKLFVAGITGTDGKTSTAHLIAQGFEALGVGCGYLGTIGYGRLGKLQTSSHTTLDPVRLQGRLAELLRDGALACAMEVSSHALDQDRVAGVHFATAALTNVGRDHLDYHGDVERYAAAKHRLFTDCVPRACVLNGDDACGERWAQEAEQAAMPARLVIRYGCNGVVPVRGTYFYARRVDTRPDGLRLEIATHAGDAVLTSSLLGRFNAYNLLAALAVISTRGSSLADAVAALSQARTVPGRMEAFSGPLFSARVVVDYAHTPQALTAALQALRPHVPGRLICVFGCGGDRDRGKRPLMGAAAATLADHAIVTDDNPRSEVPSAIVDEILAGISNERRSQVEVEHDRAHAIEMAVRAASEGDVVLVAGKGHEDYQIYGSQQRHFSDREFVARLLGLENLA
jgi:UDP-N-acetylmuramoyl-L-alanyl-D-glutamate--2,6-diaminopimelate ligase